MRLRPFLVSVGLALAVLVLLGILGSFTAVKIIVVFMVWFAILGLVALGIEVVTQSLSRALRQRR